MSSEYRCLYQQDPIPIIDCNDCEHISITESRQRKYGNNFPHICQYYSKICKHNSMERDAMVIYPCKECSFDRFKNYKKREQFMEYRCTCGRLLGRFNGQAEVKCPKCGKMNVIGGQVNEKNL